MPGAAGLCGAPKKGVGRGGGVGSVRPPPLRSLLLAERLLAPSQRPPPGRHLKCAEQVPCVEQQLCARVQAERGTHSSRRSIHPSVAPVVLWKGLQAGGSCHPGGPRPERRRERN